MNTINLIHKDMTDSECLENVKKMYKENPKFVMEPKLWKNLRLKQLKNEGKKWI